MDDWRSYDAVAELYGRIHMPRMAEPARDLVKLADVGTGMHVLDVGAGTGAVATAAAEAGADVVAVDRSVGMLDVARRLSPTLPLVAGEAIDLPFGAGAFEVVTGGFVLAHFTRPETALFDMVRVLRPGGRLAVSTWADDLDAFGQAWLELIHQVVPKEMLAPSIARAVPHRDRFRRAAGVEQVLHDAGLVKVRSEPVIYEWSYPRDDYVDGLQTWASARFARGMLGEAGWASFMDRAHRAFAARFPDPLHDRREVLLAVGTKD
ncbi:MAG TPA: methyltransferase domain-containing protein [Actinomycetota bacterium]